MSASSPIDFYCQLLPYRFLSKHFMVYPKFISHQYEKWFKHFVKTTLACYDNCMHCKALKEIIRDGTRKCLNMLYLERKRYLEGSNTIGLCVGFVSNQHAKKILQNFPYVKNAHENLSRSTYIKCLTDCDFPGLEACSLSSYFEQIVPLMTACNENTLYYTLSMLYKATMLYVKSPFAKISIVEYVLLCFHLSGLLCLTANTISHMWAEVIKYNAVLLLHKISTPDFDAIYEVM